MRHNVDVWFDEQAIGVGKSIPAEISTGLSEADYLLVVLSVHSVASNWVEREVHAALMQKTPVLPVVIDDCEIAPLLRPLRYADFRRDFDAGLQTLLRVFNEEVVAGKIQPFPVVGEGTRAPPHGELLLDLEEAIATGELRNSELGPTVLKILQEEATLELVEPYDRRWVTTGIRAADAYFRLIRLAAGQPKWQQEVVKAVTPILVGVARSLLPSADAQATMVRLCDVVVRRLRLKLIWPEDPDALNDLLNTLYSECLDAHELENDDVLATLKRLTVVGPS